MDFLKPRARATEYKMVDCTHWAEKVNGKCPWEENPENCNDCQDYVKREGRLSGDL